MKKSLVFLLHNGYSSLVLRTNNEILDLQLCDSYVLAVD